MESNFTLGQIKNHWKLELELQLQLGNFVPQNVEAPASIELWVLRMQEFYYTIEYKPDCENIVDALSRLSCCSNQQVGRIRNVAEGFVRFVAQTATTKAMTTREVEKIIPILILNCLTSADAFVKIIGTTKRML